MFSSPKMLFRFSYINISICLLMLIVLFPALGVGVGQQYSVTDYANQTVTLNAPAQRIIALAPHIVENLFSAGLGNQIVGVVDHSDYPESAKALPNIGSAAGISVEKILALQPDLIIYWQGGGNWRAIKRLQQLGLTIYADAPKTLADIERSITDFSVLGASQSTARDNLSNFSRKLEHLQEDLQEARRPGPPVTVFYQIWHQPLRTLSGDHFVSDVIRLCGGRNIFADADTIAPIVSLEGLISENPEVILIGTKNFATLSPPPKWLTLSKLWAIQHNQFYQVNPDWMHRPTLRTAKGAEIICQRLKTAQQQQQHSHQRAVNQ